MARIESDPNYTSPTFSRATAAADLFKKEDVQNLAAAMSTHQHATGNGLPVAALAASVAVPAGGTTLTGGNVVAANNLQVNGTVGVTGSATFDGDVAIQGGIAPPSTLRNTATYLDIYNDGGVRFLNQIGTGTYLTVDNTAVRAIVALTSDASVRARSDLFVGPEAGPAIRMLVDGTAGDPRLTINGRFGLSGNAISMGAGAGDVVFTRVAAAQVQITAQVGINIAPQATYALSLPNNASGGVGSGIAFAWTPYSCVDHARDLGLRLDAIDDPLGLVERLHAFSYDHVTLDESFEPVRDASGAYVTTPLFGFSAGDVAAELPELVARDAGGTPIGVDYSRLSAILWEAVHQLNDRVQVLEAA